MAGFRRLGRYFLKRRKKNGSSRRLAMRAKQSLTPASDNQVNVKNEPCDRVQMELVVETCNKNTERLSSYLRSGRLMNAVGKVMQQCQHSISQIWNGFFSILCFWRLHDQRMEILHQKVEKLQKELQLLRNNALFPPGPRCSSCHGATVMHQYQHSSVGPTIAVPFSAPPPPPPPPPPLPPPIQVPERLPLAPKSRASHSSLQEKADRHVAVTLKDLQAVQLRKVTTNNKVWMSLDGKKAPLVTLADLQKVSLRRVHCSLPLPKRHSPGRLPSKSPMKLRLQLRKVRIDGRSAEKVSHDNHTHVQDTLTQNSGGTEDINTSATSDYITQNTSSVTSQHRPSSPEY